MTKTFYFIFFFLGFVGAEGFGNANSDTSCAVEMIWRGENNTFYSGVDAVQFDAQAKKRGLHSFADFNQLKVRELLGLEGGYVPKAAIVIGAGFGRDLDFLSRYTQIPLIHAVEVAPTNYNYLRLKFDSNKDLNTLRRELGLPPQSLIIHGENIGMPLCFPTNMPVSLALWMFGGILELSPTEKTRAVRNLAETIVPGGTVVVDLPLGAVTATSLVSKKNTVKIKRGGPGGEGTLYVHPVDPLTGEIQHQKIIDLFTVGNRFAFLPERDRVFYSTDGGDPKERQLLFFHRRGNTSTGGSSSLVSPFFQPQ